jgi:glycosyltransferase involved in cell wall biosynthesis
MRYSIRVVSTYPPRKCGIGTFSRDLTTAFGHFAADIASIRVAAIDKEDLRYSAPVDVVIDQYSPESWHRATELIITIARQTPVPTVVILQHEYGLDPAADGTDARGHNYVDMARKLRDDGLIVLVYLHTVLKNPDAHQKEILQNLAECSEGLLVTTESAIDILEMDPYGIDRAKLRHVDHGIRMQNPSQHDRLKAKDILGLSEQFLVTTLGMKSPNKGIHNGIRGYGRFVTESCTEIQRRRITYLIAGQYHPEFVRADDGRRFEEYQAVVHPALDESGLRWCKVDDMDNLDFMDFDIVFLDTFIDETLLLQLYSATNIMLLPYLNMEQISSGILADTLGAGRAAIATKFMYALELLDPEKHDMPGMHIDAHARGVLVDPGEEGVEQIAQALDYLVFNKEERLVMEHMAQERGHMMRWDNMAWDLLQFAELVREQRERVTGRGVPFARKKESAYGKLNQKLSSQMESSI